jgi:tetratricopeptide (TPR) repeat protein
MLLEREQPNLEAALDCLVDARRGDEFATLIEGAWFYWTVRGRRPDAAYYAEASSLLTYSSPLRYAAALACLGEVLRHAGDHQRAKPLKQAALGVFLEGGQLPMAAALLADLGEIAAASGSRHEARELHLQSLALRKEVGEPGGIAHGLIGVADDLLEDGDYARATDATTKILTIAEQLDDSEFLMYGLALMGEIAARQGRYDESVDPFREALQVSFKFGHLEFAQAMLDSVARVRSALGEVELAARLWGAAESARETGGFVRGAFVPGALRELDHAIAAAKNSLPPEKFAAAWSKGRTLPVDEVVREAGER